MKKENATITLSEPQNTKSCIVEDGSGETNTPHDCSIPSPVNNGRERKKKEENKKGRKVGRGNTHFTSPILDRASTNLFATFWEALITAK